MKFTKGLLPLALAALVPARAATVYDQEGTALDIFGRVNVLARNAGAARADRASSNDGSDWGLFNSARLGLAGRAEIGSGIYALGLAEWELASGDGCDGMSARYQFIGVDARNYGTLLFGRGDNAFYTVAGATDIYHTLDSWVSDYYLTGDQNSGLAMYSLSTLGWDFRASFGAAKSALNGTPLSYKYQAAAALAARLSSGITVAYGLAYYKFSYEGDSRAQISYFADRMAYMHNLDAGEKLAYAASHRPGHKVDKGISLSYGTLGEGLYLAANYTWTRYEAYRHHLYSFELAADYAFENGLGLTLGYGAKRYSHTNLIGDLNLGARFSFSPRFKIFAEAQLDISSHPEIYYTSEEIAERALGENKLVIGAEYLY